MIFGATAGSTMVDRICHRFAPRVMAVSINSARTARVWSMISVMRKKITPMNRSASFEPSPAPNQISSSGIKAGAGR